MLLYVARLANLLLWLACMSAAVYAAGRYGWILLQVALLPMTLSLGPAVSADASLLSLAFLFTGLVMAAVECDPSAEASWRAWALAAIFVLFALCKAYLLLWPIVLAAPAYRRGWRLAVLVGALLVGGTLVVGWSRVVHGIGPPHIVSAAAQRAFIVAHPLNALCALGASMLPDGLDVKQTIGALAWLNLELPMAVYIGYLALLIAVPLLSVGRARLTTGGRLALLAAAFSLHAFVHAMIYQIATPTGESRVLGLQGRYYLPYLPAALLALCGRVLPRWRRVWRRRQSMLVPSANILLLAAATLRIAMRYYGP
jgi:uncharacterized membrane protein